MAGFSSSDLFTSVYNLILSIHWLYITSINSYTLPVVTTFIRRIDDFKNSPSTTPPLPKKELLDTFLFIETVFRNVLIIIFYDWTQEDSSCSAYE